MSTRSKQPTIKCGRCARRYRHLADWNAVIEGGVVTGALCPACQSPEENAEAEMNAIPVVRMTRNDLAADLITRTETAMRTVSELVVDTKITFEVQDIVRVVEDELPPGYLTTADPDDRREMIRNIARDVLSGALYED